MLYEPRMFLEFEPGKPDWFSPSLQSDQRAQPKILRWNKRLLGRPGLL
jgi:hypothetical protein